MGRGLSDFQKYILEMAYHQRKGFMGVSNPPEWDLKQANIIGEENFGFPTTLNSMKASTSRAVSRLAKRGLMVNLGHGFMKVTEEGMKIGEGLYRLTLDEKREIRKPRGERLTVIKMTEGGGKKTLFEEEIEEKYGEEGLKRFRKLMKEDRKKRKEFWNKINKGLSVIIGKDDI